MPNGSVTVPPALRTWMRSLVVELLTARTWIAWVPVVQPATTLDSWMPWSNVNVSTSPLPIVLLVTLAWMSVPRGP